MLYFRKIGSLDPEFDSKAPNSTSQLEETGQARNPPPERDNPTSERDKIPPESDQTQKSDGLQLRSSSLNFLNKTFSQDSKYPSDQTILSSISSTLQLSHVRPLGISFFLNQHHVHPYKFHRVQLLSRQVFH